MSSDINIKIKNKLESERRDMNVYHCSTRSAHMISYNSSITIPLRPILENDYLNISLVIEAGPLENKSFVNLPSWLNFEYFSKNHFKIIHSGGRTILKIPPGHPTWKLKMVRSNEELSNKLSDHIIVGEDRL
jgi:hypothetical protein